MCRLIPVLAGCRARYGGLSASLVVIGMIVILMFLGCFLDQVSTMLVTLPIFMPLVLQYQIDPIWFGVIFLFCMQLGLLTPPFGLLLFTMKGVAPAGVTMQDIYRAAFPYVVMGFLMMMLVFTFPLIATWVTKLFGD